MRINADFNSAVHVDSESLAWHASPLPGVERRMLDRIGEEVARATTIVRYAPGSFFSPHRHDGGEEFLVLEGVFSDEHGDYGPLTYVRNPRGSTHKPFSKDGCTIFVKLWQMEEADQDFKRIDTTKGEWLTGPIGGIEEQPLHQYGNETVCLERWQPGTHYKARTYEGGAEYLVLEGQVSDGAGTYKQGAWLRLPPGHCHDLESSTGALVYLKTGHLMSVEAPQPSR